MAVPSPAPHRPILLKLLAGRQQGAEAVLTEGVTYLIGSTDACDIVLQDQGVAPQHLTVTVQHGRLHLAAQEQPVNLSDQELAPGQTGDLAAGVLLQLGNVRLGIGVEETDWAALPHPQLPGTAPAVGETPAEAETLASAPEQPATLAPTARTRRWPMFAALLLIAALSAGSWMLSGNGLNGGDSLPTPQPTALEKAQAAAAALALENIRIEAHPASGAVIVSGYCPSQALKQQLTTALSAQGVVADNRLWPEDLTQDALANTVERLGGKRLRYDYLGEGRLRLQGRVTDDAQRQRLLETLYNDVPALHQIDSGVQTIPELAAQLQEQLQQADLRLTITAKEQTITVSGALDAEHLTRWNAMAEAFNAATDGFPALEQRIQSVSAVRQPPAFSHSAAPTAPPIDELRIAIRGIMISANQPAYALLHNGLRVTEGDWIEGRYQVETINLNQVIMRDGAQRKIYAIGGSSR